MRVAPIALSAFPLTLVGLMVAERSALLALGAFPDSAFAWMFWLNLHAGFGRLWQASETVIGGMVPIHLIGLAIVAVVLVAAAGSRRWPSYMFLSNHLALIMAVAFSLMGTQAKVSSLGEGFLSSGHWALVWATEISASQFCMLVAGLASSLVCHVALLRHLNNRGAPVALRITCLQRNL
jgi:hypothetical protein